MAYTTIDDPAKHFNTVIYTGNGSTQSITGVGFQPDWTWIKERGAVNNHELYDVARGVTKRIYSDLTNAEDTNSTGLTAFGTDGFTLGGAGGTNNNSDTYVAWNWKAGGAASSNTDGDVTASVSANTTAGFSIVKFTSSSSSGAMTVGHGLGATPQVVIVKDIGASGNWQTYFEGIGTANQQYLKLNATDAVTNISGLWGAGMTSSVIGIGVGVAVDANESDIAYCFAEKKGYSKFFSYEGNSNSDGPFVYLGFRPAWLMVKPIDASDNWVMFDNKRHNALNSSVSPYFLYANKNFAETTDTKLIDFLSNGFKIRASGNTVNRSSTFIGMAFAEQPFVNSSGIPCNAR